MRLSRNTVRSVCNSASYDSVADGTVVVNEVDACCALSEFGERRRVGRVAVATFFLVVVLDRERDWALDFDDSSFSSTRPPAAARHGPWWEWSIVDCDDGGCTLRELRGKALAEDGKNDEESLLL